MRILIAVNGRVGSRVAGPEIRGWELARAIGERHEVTVAFEDPPARERAGHRIVPLTRSRLAREARRHDAVIAPVLPPFLFAALNGTSTLTVSDQYDPIQLEISIFDEQPGIARAIRAQQHVRRLQLRFADVVACAGERQRELLEAELHALPKGPVPPPAIVTVPFGLAEAPRSVARGMLRGRFPGIGRGDPLVLWWGKVWKWFDAETAIEAFGHVAKRRPDARLVISAGKSPSAAFDRSERTEGAKDLARRLGLLDRNVFFLDEWIPYERRHEFLADADVGITLHADTAEAPFAARARYMDYLWTSLPPILARGDEVAERFGRAGFARLVPPGDAEQAAEAMLDLINDSRARDAARQAGRGLADKYRWQTVAGPLAAAIEDRAPRPNRTLSPRLVKEAGAYYLRRTIDHGVALPPIRALGRQSEQPTGSSRSPTAFVA